MAFPHPAGEKRHLGWLRHYLVAATSGGQAGHALAGASGGALHLYDLRNKLVAASMPLHAVRGGVHRALWSACSHAMPRAHHAPA